MTGRSAVVFLFAAVCMVTFWQASAQNLITITSPVSVGYSFPGSRLPVVYNASDSVTTIRWTAYLLNSTVLTSLDWLNITTTDFETLYPPVSTTVILSDSRLTPGLHTLTWKVAKTAPRGAYYIVPNTTIAGNSVRLYVIPAVIGVAPSYSSVFPPQVPLYSGNLPVPQLLPQRPKVAPGSTITFEWKNTTAVSSTSSIVTVLPQSSFPMQSIIQFFVNGAPDAATILGLPNAQVVSLDATSPLNYTVPAEAPAGPWVFSVATSSVYSEYGFSYYEVTAGGAVPTPGADTTPAGDALSPSPDAESSSTPDAESSSTPDATSKLPSPTSPPTNVPRSGALQTRSLGNLLIAAVATITFLICSL